jgi:hypothetical protein
MSSITEVFAAKNLIKEARYRVPTITAYNRMETRARTEDFEKSLRAEIFDGLWMLTRQWQMGEFEAHDGGSAIDARLMTRTTQIDSISIAGHTDVYDNTVPLETRVEREFLKSPFPLSLKVQMGQYFLRLHSPALRAAYSDQYLKHYPLDQNLAVRISAMQESMQLYMATKARSLDGEQIYNDLLSGSFAGAIGWKTTGDQSAVLGLGNDFIDWFKRQYSQPPQPNLSGWDPQTMQYSCTIAAPDSTGSQKTLNLREYYSGRLDWFAFDEDLAESVPEDRVSSDETRKVPDEKLISFIPTPAIFRGMPSPRFWEMEDRQIDFGNLNAKTTDHLLLEFSEFALIYSNDWFIVPYRLAHNSLCEIKGLIVTDTFGDRTWIDSADGGSDNQWQNWSVFNLSNTGHMGMYNRQFFLPSTVGGALESDSIEQVNLIRDEMANMVWAIEDIVPDETGRGVDGGLIAAPPPQMPPVTSSTATIQYILGNSVPENWIPFIPVHKPGSNQEIYFQRAAFPKLGSPPQEVVKAKGVLLNEKAAPYYINEEEVPNSGTILTRRYIRTRWINGSTFLWIGRKKENGRGPGRSNLAFDQIIPILNT